MIHRQLLSTALAAGLFGPLLAAADILVVKGGPGDNASHLPHRDGEARCTVTRPKGMSAADWAAWRQIHIHGPIDVFDSVRLKQALDKIELAADVRALRISICSPGGVYFEAPRMIKVIREYATKTGLQIITSAVERGAWSAAAMVWLAGDCLQIDQDSSAVGFHAAYDKRDKSKVAVLLPQIRGLIKLHLGRMAPGGFEAKAGATQLRRVPGDPGFLAKTIDEYIELVFDAKGAGAFIVIKSDFGIDLWEQAKFAAHSAKWPAQYGAFLRDVLEQGLALQKSKGFRSLIARANYRFWYPKTKANSRVAKGRASGALTPVRCLRSAAAAQRLRPAQLGRALLPPHVLVDWKTPQLAEPYRSYGEYLFWCLSPVGQDGQQLPALKPRSLESWLASPTRRTPPYSNLIPDAIKQARARAAARIRADRSRRTRLYTDLDAALLAIQKSLPDLDHRVTYKTGSTQYRYRGHLDKKLRRLTIEQESNGKSSRQLFAPLHKFWLRTKVRTNTTFGLHMVSQHTRNESGKRSALPRTYLMSRGLGQSPQARRKLQGLVAAMQRAQDLADEIDTINHRLATKPKSRSK